MEMLTKKCVTYANQLDKARGDRDRLLTDVSEREDEISSMRLTIAQLEGDITRLKVEVQKADRNLTQVRVLRRCVGV
jgi:chromosome segregation ATPase